MGSRNWMAPEQLLGGLLKKPCDIYALGMTIYEVSRGLMVSHIVSLTPNYQDLYKRDSAGTRKLRRFYRAGSTTECSTGTTR